MSKKEQFKALTKEYAKKVLKLLDEEGESCVPEGHATFSKGGGRSDAPSGRITSPKEEEEEEGSSVPSGHGTSPTFQCEGYVWEEPPQPCKGGTRSNIKTGIRFNNKIRTVCKECANARERLKNKEKREKKKREKEGGNSDPPQGGQSSPKKKSKTKE